MYEHKDETLCPVKTCLLKQAGCLIDYEKESIIVEEIGNKEIVLSLYSFLESAD